MKQIQHAANGKRLPAQFCPVCAYRMDSASHHAGERWRPRPKDLSVCLNCGEPFSFDESMNLVRLAADALLSLKAESPEAYEELCATQRLIRDKRPLRHEKN